MSGHPRNEKAGHGEYQKACEEVRRYASDPFAAPEVALRACLLAVTEALSGPEALPDRNDPLRILAREIIEGTQP